jgi:sphingosine kinase
MKDFKPKDSAITVLKNHKNYSKNQRCEKLFNKHLNYEYKYLTSLDKPVPNDWLTIEDNFIIFLIIKLPLIGMDFVISPETKFNDECMVLAFNKEGTPRLELIDIVNDSGSGKFLLKPSMNFVKCKAFRLEPDESRKGNLMVDGERVDYGPIQGEILPKLASVLSR